MGGLDEITDRYFQDTEGGFAAIVRSLGAARTETELTDDEVAVLRSVGRNTAGIRKLAEYQSSEQMLAMEYLGPVTPHAPFDLSLCDRYLAGQDMSVIVLTDFKGMPRGIIPLEPFTDRISAFISLRKSGHIIVTDTIPYSYENIRALESSECDYILRLQQFPVSFGPSSNQKNLPLKHNGKDYAACKCRYDKKWLFKFVETNDTESVRKSVSNMKLRIQESSFFNESAGHEHAISNIGHDIREVRDIIDARMRMDRAMGLCRILLSSDDRLLYDRDATIGFITAFILGYAELGPKASE